MMISKIQRLSDNLIRNHALFCARHRKPRSDVTLTYDFNRLETVGIQSCSLLIQSIEVSIVKKVLSGTGRFIQFPLNNHIT